eukprot:7073554-Alexandrium_andersonii.AAC.1
MGAATLGTASCFCGGGGGICPLPTRATGGPATEDPLLRRRSSRVLGPALDCRRCSCSARRQCSGMP